MNILGNSENVTVSFDNRIPGIRYKKIPPWMTSIDVRPNSHNEFTAKCLGVIQEARITTSSLYIAVVSKLEDYLIMNQHTEYLPEIEWTMRDAEELARTIVFDRTDPKYVERTEACLAVWFKYLLDLISDTFYVAQTRSGDIIRTVTIHVMKARYFDVIRVELIRPKVMQIGI